MKRRKFIQASGLGLLSITSASQVWSALEGVDKTTLASAELLADLDALCDLMIPDTDTLGAKSVGVAPWLIIASEHELEGANSSTLTNFLNVLSPSGSFAEVPQSDQIKRLSEVDAQAFKEYSDSEIATLWRTVKALILTGYYSSKVGASEELRYKLIPGHLLPEVDITQDESANRAWSSDWMAGKL
ncbi:gluconate 2-dehydrogenase subunit 3 family protein [Aestuariicella hydrocarbonica]|uniref:Gluconate 2-dehydrogenase subunit 3 family protein n=1 Tax=Pseudomaricurvus hydrocarbonicus TaxID=1470433 RepID=A0A9E5MN89_9GAMM|nr:gluconate 2-dehydrogenase subunit 3 family protein [Aestuariicella hydrocarbonica]NHO67389.1 gluconate 2-dehydrogenase subunit 3 family protein [Aestuariicella hydrocarbonica]